MGNKYSGLQVKLTFWFLAVSLLAVGGMAGLAGGIASSAMEKAYFNSLSTIAESREQHLVTFIKEKIESIRIMADNKAYEDLNNLAVINGELKQAAKKFPDFYELFICNVNGMIIASIDKSHLGLDRAKDQYFLTARQGISTVKDIYKSSTTGKVGMAVSTPLYDAAGSKIIGVLVGRISMDGLEKIMANDVGQGRSGDAYLVNKEGYFISSSRFDKSVVLNRKIETPPVKAWHDKGKEYLGIYTGWRGERVIGASMAKTFNKELGKDWLLLTEIDASEAFAPIAAMRLVGFIALILIAVLIIIVSYYLANNIAKPIVSLSRALRCMETGDLTAKIEKSRLKDEVGTLINEAASMLEKLKGLISNVSQAALQVNSSTTEMRASIQEQVSGAAEQSSAVAETSSAIAELSQTAGNISKISQDVQKATELTMAGINEANTKINETAQKILTLGEKSQSIGDVVKIINDLSDQINLLALNAKIEAARAGEAGKGFAVVATEISKLSDKSSQSTEEIRKLVSEIQAETSAAVMGVEESVKRGAKGVELTQSALQKSKEITMATQQQQTASDQVTIAVKNIDQVAKQFVESTKQTELAVENLSKLANNFKKTVEQFKL